MTEPFGQVHSLTHEKEGALKSFARFVNQQLEEMDYLNAQHKIQVKRNRLEKLLLTDDKVFDAIYAACPKRKKLQAAQARSILEFDGRPVSPSRGEIAKEIVDWLMPLP